MDSLSIVIAVVVIGGMGLCIGLLLGVAGKKFAVEIDEKEGQIRTILPGNNCGGCGFAGCDDLANALSQGRVNVDVCPVISDEAIEQLAGILGVTADKHKRMVARIKCKGTCAKTTNQYHYFGLRDCRKLALIPGRGEKSCDYACMGLGSCERICPFNAIITKDGIAVVDKEECKACGKCIEICPNHLIDLIPYDATYQVYCNSNAKGKNVKAVCEVGCIGCGLCKKQCEQDAIVFENNLAYIDGEKCSSCGKCAEKCPTQIIM